MSAFGQGLAAFLRMLATGRRFRVMIGLVLAMGWVGVATYADLVIRNVPIAVLDLDNSRVSRTIRTYLAATRELDVLAQSPASLDEARRWLIEGRATAVVLLPSTLSTDLKRGRKAEVLVAIDMSNILTGRNAYKAIAKAVGTVSAGVQLTYVTRLGDRQDQAMAAVVPIVVDENPTFNPATNYAVYLVPGLLFFLLHVFVLLLALSIDLPGSALPTRAHRLGASAGVLAVGFAVGMLFLHGYLPADAVVPASGRWLASGWVALLVAADLLMARAVRAALPSLLAAVEVTIVLGMLSLMLSGITWPTDMFPAPLRWLAAAIPFTPFAQGFQLLLHHPVAPGDLAIHLASFARQAIGFVALIAAGAGVRAARSALRARPRGGAA